jgi:small subunit ribosomal protein S4
MEKQKFRYFYGLQEKQFRAVYETARRRKGVTGETMLQILETRLDNAVFQLGFASSRPAARQMVGHGHVLVNGKKVDISSYALQVNDTVEIKNSSVSRQMATKNMEISTSRRVPEWLHLDKDFFKGVIMRVPTKEEIQPIGSEQMVVEFYSR